jgi:Lon protease-like protein
MKRKPTPEEHKMLDKIADALRGSTRADPMGDLIDAVEKGNTDMPTTNTQKLTLLVPTETHRKLKVLAAQEGKTMTEILLQLIETRLADADEQKK